MTTKQISTEVTIPRGAFTHTGFLQEAKRRCMTLQQREFQLRSFI